LLEKRGRLGRRSRHLCRGRREVVRQLRWGGSWSWRWWWALRRGRWLIHVWLLEVVLVVINYTER
jgi:hypothetical protein